MLDRSSRLVMMCTATVGDHNIDGDNGEEEFAGELSSEDREIEKVLDLVAEESSCIVCSKL